MIKDKLLEQQGSSSKHNNQHQFYIGIGQVNNAKVIYPVQSLVMSDQDKIYFDTKENTFKAIAEVNKTFSIKQLFNYIGEY